MSDTVIRKLQEHDQLVCQVIDISPETSLYKFDGDNNKWEKLNVDGTFFLCKRTMTPFNCFFISSSTGAEVIREYLTKDIMVQLQAPFLLYKRTVFSGMCEVKGILFKEERECRRVASVVSQLLKESASSPREAAPNAMKSSTPSDPPSAALPPNSHAIPPSPATGPNSIIRMLHSAAAKHPAKTPDAGRARPQTIGGPQQPPNPQSKSAGHWSNKTHTISVDYLFKSLGSNAGQRSPPRASSPKRATPTQPVATGGGGGGGNYLTLSEVEQRAMVEASECLRQQLGISGANDAVVSGRGDGRPAAGGGGTARSFPTAVVSVDEDGEDEEGLVLTPNMMETTVVAGFPTPKADKAAKSPGGERASAVEALALSKTQLRQALIRMIEEDDDFVARVHGAYMANLQRHLK